MSENPSTVKFMMIQSGLVPENVVLQLVNWRLLPEDSARLTGSRPINMEKEWDDVESFVKDLRSALDVEAQTIRETELDPDGGYRSVSVQVPSDTQDWVAVEAFVDRLGRVFLPPRPAFGEAISVIFLDEGNGGNSETRKVVRVESRFRGEKVAAYVVYVEG